MFDIVVNDGSGLKNLLTITGGSSYSISYGGTVFSSGTLPATVPMPVDVNGNIKKGLYNVTIDGVLNVFDYQYEPLGLSVDVTVNGFTSHIRISDTTEYGNVVVLSKTLVVDEPNLAHTETSNDFTKTSIYSGNWKYSLVANIKRTFPSNLNVFDRLKTEGDRNVYNITKDNVFEASSELFSAYREAYKINVAQSDRMENDVVACQAFLNSFYRYVIDSDAINAYSCLDSIAKIISLELIVAPIVPFSIDLGSNVDTYKAKIDGNDTPRFIGEMLGGTMEVKNGFIESKGSGKVSIAGEAAAFLEGKIDNDTIKTDGQKIFANVNYTNLTPVPEKALGIDVGTTFNNVPISNVLDMLIYQYAYPVITLTAPTNRVLEVGESVSGQMPVTWSVQNKQNVKAGGYKMIYLPSSTEVFAESDINATMGTFVHPLTVRSTAATVNVFKFYLTDTKNTQRSVNVQYNWNHRIYYGESANSPLTEAQVKALRVSALFPSFLGSYQMNTGGYKYICIPVDMGVAARFRDVATGLLVPFNDPYVVSVTNSFGVSIPYNVYRTANVLGGSINIEIY